MTDEETLFAAVRANPDEDTPRLAYADWLDEHRGADAPGPIRPARPAKVAPGTGSDRAEYIRVECELARLRDADPTPEMKARVKELTARERALGKAVRKAWEAPFRNGKPFGGPHRKFHFDRGLPDWVILDGHEIMDYGEAFLRRTPVAHFHVYEMSAQRLARLLGAEWLRLLPRLSVYSAGIPLAHGPADPGQFADSPNTPHLTHLALSGRWTLTPEGADRLARSTSLPALRSLDLYQSAFEAAGFARLFDGPALRGLTELLLNTLPLAPGELAAILASPTLAGVERLMLSEVGLGRAEGEALAKSPMWPNLRWAILSGTMAEFAPPLESAPVGRLEELLVRWCQLGDAELTSLARWPVWHSVRKLELPYCPGITAAGWKALIAAMAPGVIRELWLSHCAVGDDGAKLLADAPHLTGLRTLILGSTGIGDAGALALAGSPHLGRLRHLGLSGCPIGDAARRALRKRFGDAVKF